MVSAPFDPSLSPKPWPEYFPHAQDTLIAVGAIALNYGQLENTLKNVFCAATGMNYDHLSVLFHRIPNNVRKDALNELAAKTELPDSLKKLTVTFVNYFDICASNRNDIMHAFASGEYRDAALGERGLLLSKYSKSGKRLHCSAKTSDLRRVADDIHAVMMFGGSLSATIKFVLHARKKDRLSALAKIIQPAISSEPKSLSWSSHAAPAKRKPPPPSAPVTVRIDLSGGARKRSK